jgi:PIN domain nuclease of toxin-antitoxin system
MNYLLDTHTFIWFNEDAAELSVKAKQAIEAEDAVNFISIVSLREIAIKISLEKLELKKPFAEINKQIEQNGFIVLPVEFEDTLIVSQLPYHHKDPFDRILASQSLNRDFTFITTDPNIAKYGVKTYW